MRKTLHFFDLQILKQCSLIFSLIYRDEKFLETVFPIKDDRWESSCYDEAQKIVRISSDEFLACQKDSSKDTPINRRHFRGRNLKISPGLSDLSRSARFVLSQRLLSH